MAASTIRIVGIRKVNAAFRQIDRALATQFGEDLKKAAEPVAVAARAKVTRYAGSSPGTILARRSGARIFVVQNARKVTGRRGDFGALQMRRALEPALDENAARIFTDVERVLDKYADSAGF